MIVASNTRRPRNVDVPRAAAILYGDWGTSKAYVIGLAFAVGGYGSFWLIAAMCVLTALVGVNYMVICRHYPDGGGVYASVRHRSEIVSIVGAFLLIADYIVTAALSALSAFAYLKVPHPEIFAAAVDRIDRGVEHLRAQAAYGQPSRAGFGADSGGGFVAGVVFHSASARSSAAFGAFERWLRQELERVCRRGPRPFRRGSHRQFDRRDEAQQGMQRRQSQCIKDLHAGHPVGHA